MRLLKFASLFVLLAIGLALAATEVEDVGYIAYLYRLGETRTALLKIDDFLQQYPDSPFAPDVLFLRAGIDLTDGRYARSRDTYLDLQRRNTDPSMRAEIALGLAQAQYFLGEHDAAEAGLRQFVQSAPEHPLNAKAWYFLGKIAQDAGHHAEALEAFDTATRYGEDPAVQVARVASLAQLGKYEQAERAITNLFSAGQTRSGEEALLLYHDVNQRRNRAARVLSFESDRIEAGSPYYADYILLLAKANYELGHYEEAIRRVDRLQQPGDEAGYLRALSLLALNRNVEAKAAFQKLHQTATDEAIATNSYFYLARLDANEGNGSAMLNDFLRQHPDHPLAGVARYQLGMNAMDTGEYALAAQSFEEAVVSPLEPLNEEKARYMLAEAYFLSGARDLAQSAYRDYLERYPKGRFVDEALFKLALIDFEAKRYDRAEERFARLQSDYPSSPKVGMAAFYLGEIAFFDGRFTFALQRYQQALQGQTDVGYTQERIARIHFQNKDYAAALRAIDAIPAGPRYAYDKYLLAGDIYFARKEYAQALRAYQQADDAAQTTDLHEAVRSRLAWTYYQQGDYDRASQIYSELTAHSSSPETFLMLAAQAAFSADDYLTAIQYYRQYIQDYSQTKGYNQAMLGLADSYYNLGSYAKAVDYYRPLVRPGTAPELLDNALNGLVWSARQSDEVDLPSELDRLLAQYRSSALAPRLLHRKAEWLLEQKRYDEAVMVCNDITRDYPEYPASLDVYKLLAQCYRAQGKQTLAESVFVRMHELAGDDPDVLFDWAQTKLTAGDHAGAIEKLELAADNTQQARVWLLLLQTQLAGNDANFLQRYQAFSRFAGERELADAQLLWVDWQVQHGQMGLVDAVLTSLLQSQWNDVRAQAQYWRGRVLYEQGSYQEAVAELLRVRYLFPQATQMQLLAEYYACLAWIELDESDKARDRFETIRAGLSPMQVETLEARLGGE